MQDNTALKQKFTAQFGYTPQWIFSAPGRTELSGNHTDHQHGVVLAAAVDLDTRAAVAENDKNCIRLFSEGYCLYEIPLPVGEPRADAYGTTASLISGVAARFAALGYPVRGFDAYVVSRVLSGSGLSSSAAFEVMIGNILNHLYNDGRVPNVEIAKMAQFAENRYFGKPCGLMDQTACAVGGFITIDFADPTAPVIEKMDFDLTAAGYSLCIVNTGGNHADLNEDYASVPAEMKAVARALGVSVLRETTEEAVIANIVRLRSEVGDRAILRALHFFNENRRVAAQVEALRAGDFEAFKAGVTASGNSSFKYLQNVYTNKNIAEQGLSLALCLTEDFLAGTGAVSRVHGGGFAGTIQAFVPVHDTAAYAARMNAVFGEGACHILSVRPSGACRIL